MNQRCKVIALGGDTLFYESGNAVVEVREGKPWSSVGQARDLYKASRTHDALELSTAWGDRAKAWFGQRSKEEMRGIARDGKYLVSGGFINFDKQAKPSVHGLNLNYDPASGNFPLVPNSQTPGDIGAAGTDVYLVSEFTENRSNRAQLAHGSLSQPSVTRDLRAGVTFVQEAIQFVIDNLPPEDKGHVAPPFDVAIMQPSGIVWLARKDGCYKEDVLPANPKTTQRVHSK